MLETKLYHVWPKKTKIIKTFLQVSTSISVLIISINTIWKSHNWSFLFGNVDVSIAFLHNNASRNPSFLRLSPLLLLHCFGSYRRTCFPGIYFLRHSLLLLFSIRNNRLKKKLASSIIAHFSFHCIY